MHLSVHYAIYLNSLNKMQSTVNTLAHYSLLFFSRNILGQLLAMQHLVIIKVSRTKSNLKNKQTNKQTNVETFTSKTSVFLWFNSRPTYFVGFMVYLRSKISPNVYNLVFVLKESSSARAGFTSARNESDWLIFARVVLHLLRHKEKFSVAKQDSFTPDEQKIVC